MVYSGNFIELDDLGVPLCLETSKCSKRPRATFKTPPRRTKDWRGTQKVHRANQGTHRFSVWSFKDLIFAMGEAEFLMRLVTVYDFELSLQIGYSIIFLDCSGHLNLFSDHEGCAPSKSHAMDFRSSYQKSPFGGDPRAILRTSYLVTGIQPGRQIAGHSPTVEMGAEHRQKIHSL